MPSQPTLSADALLQQVHRRFERLGHDGAAAVNQAAAGQVINASEDKVRDLLADFRQATYQAAVQLRTDDAHRLVAVTRGDCTQAGRLMRRDAGRVGLDKADDKVAVVDGSEWIKKQIQRQSLPLDDLGLDFSHLSENLHKARRVVYGEEDPQDEKAPGNAWVGSLLHTAKHEGYEKLREQLPEWKSGLRGASRRQAAEQVLNYVTDRREMIPYPKFLAMGRQIGSGAAESMCKATTQRLKGRGMGWDGDNAESIMALEALEQSEAWQDYWETQF